MFWRYFNLALTFSMVALWVLATLTGLINSVAFVGHVSMLALVLAGWSAYRSDTPTPKREEEQ